MTERELVDAVVKLATAAQGEHPCAAGVLFHLAGAVTAGPEFQRNAFDRACEQAAEFLQFITGEGEAIS